MPSISKEQVKLARQELKKQLGKEWKLSVSRPRPGMSIRVVVLSGPLPFPYEGRTHKQIHFGGATQLRCTHFRDRPEWAAVLNTILKICGQDMSGGFHDSDYGYVPGHYIQLDLGDWDRPYTQKINGQVIEAPATEVAKEIDEPALPVISARPATEVAPEKKPVLRLVPPAPQQSAQADLMELLGL